MSRDLHDDCLRILRTKAAELSADEIAALNRVAGRLATNNADAADCRTANDIIWSFHSQGPGRPPPMADLPALAAATAALSR